MARTEGKRPEPRGKLENHQRGRARRALPTVDDHREPRMNPRVLLGIGGALAVLLFIVVVAVGLSNEEAPSGAMPDNPDVQIDGGTLPPHDPQATSDPAEGAIAPEFASVDFAGMPQSLAHDGTPKAVLFLAHWCPHCQAEVPPLQAYMDGTGLPAGTQLISVATANDPTRANYPPSAWLEREGWTAPVLVDDMASAIARSYGLAAFPYYVILDGDGTVVERITGAVAPEAVAALLAELAMAG